MRARKLTAGLLSLAIAASSAVPCFGASFFYGETPLKYRIGGLQELIEEIRENYKDETDLDTMFNGIYKGLFDSLGDRWSKYVTPMEDGLNLVTTDLEEEYEGIGVVMRKTGGGLLITSTVLGSPAYHAGIRTGDYILKVGNVDVTQMESTQVADLIRGSGNTSVTLTVDRDGVNKVFTVNRTTISTKTVSSKMMEDNTGYIKIDSFDSKTFESFKTAYEDLIAKGMDSLVLDVRDNGGGLLGSAVQVADYLIHKEGLISTFVRQGKTVQTVYSEADSNAQVPVALLINGESASATELLAAALKERGAATLIGTATYGKGVAQTVVSTVQGSYYKLSVYYFLTPDGNNIDGVGVAPNISVYNPQGLSAEELAKLKDGLAPITETTKYYAGGSGLNVYGVQQRLAYMGYDVDRTGVMDEKTVEALKLVQAQAGASPYGGLDYCTLGIIEDMFDAYCNPKAEDLQLEKAKEFLNQ